MYQFNENGVCTDPEIFMQTKTKEHYTTLKICQLPNGNWTYGYNFGVMFGDMAGEASPASIHGPQYPTPEAAKKAAIEYYQPKIQAIIQSAKEYNRNHRTDTTPPGKQTTLTIQTTLF